MPPSLIAGDTGKCANSELSARFCSHRESYVYNQKIHTCRKGRQLVSIFEGLFVSDSVQTSFAKMKGEAYESFYENKK